MKENRAFHSGMKKVRKLETVFKKKHHALKNNVSDSYKLPNEDLLAQWGILDESFTEKQGVIKPSARNEDNKKLNKPLNARLLVKWHILTESDQTENHSVKVRD